MSAVGRQVADHALQHLDLSDVTLPDEYYYASLPLCVIDAVFSIGVKYESTQRTVRDWCAAQVPVWPRFRSESDKQHSISDFVALLGCKSPDYFADNIFRNRQRTSSKSGILKAEAVLHFAKVLQHHGIEFLGDTEDDQRNLAIQSEVALVPGQKSGISFEYFLMLAGSENFVKADRMLQRFVSEATGVAASPNEARKAVISASELLRSEGYELYPRTLDYKIWSFQRDVSR